MAPKFQVTFDCAEPGRLAEFWAAALNYRLQPPPEGFGSWDEFATANNIPRDQWDAVSAIVDPDGGPRLFFQRVPEGKIVKNRVHLDVNVSSRDSDLPVRKEEIDRAVEHLMDLGATQLKAFELHSEYWVVMADPEGNEFCVQ